MLNQSRQACSCGKAPAKSSQRLFVTTSQLASTNTNQITPASSTPTIASATKVRSVPLRERKRL